MSILEGLKIVTAKEMARVEAMAVSEGASEMAFMENAAEGIAEEVQDFVERFALEKSATLLIGKGNNGGDAYAAGAFLLAEGFRVTALHCYALEHCSPLCKTMHDRFKAAGGAVSFVQQESDFVFDPDGVIVDGLVGTGFKGKAEDILELAIQCANRSGIPIIAVDIPSGVNGDAGEVGSVAIQATETVFLELPKIGFFLESGWDHVGELKLARFGLADKYIDDAKAIAMLFPAENAFSLLPPIQRSRHKYQAGYVLAVAGSEGMPGAAILAGYGALRSGAGIVRLFHPYGMEAELSGAPFELIREGWDERDLGRIRHEAMRAKTLLIGPGIGRGSGPKNMVRKVLKEIALPMVIDADALYFLSAHDWHIPKGSILTPHRGEMQLLLNHFPHTGKDLMQSCQAYAEAKEAVIVLKGAPTMVFSPGELPIIVMSGDPGMATAGSGDVLTGVIAALRAQGLAPRQAAALGVYLHGRAGEIAASNLTSYCMTASDLLEFLPEAFSLLSLAQTLP